MNSQVNPPVTRHRILIADDNEMIREAIGSVLGMKGYDVLECEDGAQAIEILSTEHIDFMILDLQMPNVTGYKVLEWLSKQTLSLGVVVCTGTIVDADVLETLGVMVFQKPFRMRALLDEISAALATTAV